MANWKPVVGYEGLYEVSDEGEVKSLSRKTIDGSRGIRERLMKPMKNPNGDMSVHLTKNKVQRTHMIHLLVANAFLPKIDGLDGVRHLDENKANNAAYNLERCSINEIKYTSGRSQHLLS